MHSHPNAEHVAVVAGVEVAVEVNDRTVVAAWGHVI